VKVTENPRRAMYLLMQRHAHATEPPNVTFFHCDNYSIVNSLHPGEEHAAAGLFVVGHARVGVSAAAE
jgi:hypothetical protein